MWRLAATRLDNAELEKPKTYLGCLHCHQTILVTLVLNRRGEADFPRFSLMVKPAVKPVAASTYQMVPISGLCQQHP